MFSDSHVIYFDLADDLSTTIHSIAIPEPKKPTLFGDFAFFPNGGAGVMVIHLKPGEAPRVAMQIDRKVMYEVTYNKRLRVLPGQSDGGEDEVQNYHRYNSLNVVDVSL